ncbi:MAG TPA: hypothetical protein GXX33_05800 [Firmicutes bacterium]|uniref:Flagellar assembly protein T N-terminal domain-containing protein n=1 Tax=Capillibacterium thermochitinicola TaxID=2699427 RepID=A0A8J6HZG3_9FIRM|nr:hypothetical protein [Capillibacterium thermochitinicola]MBA2132750.1 hypothetical protein [Capillibacterium thermochitinicola]HHW12497.1 hypothetical protein [Bacillota bacterium]
MKKFRLIWLCFFLFLAVSPVASELAEEETIVLQVVGEALLNAGDIAKARELAVANGLQQAVEQAVGILVYSETQVENYELIRDSIRLRSAGYVSSYEIIDYWVEQNVCKVLLTVGIKRGRMIEDLQELRLNLKLAGDPRLLVSVVAINRDLATAGLETQLVDGLRQAGYQVVTAGGQQAGGAQHDLLVQGMVLGEILGRFHGFVSCRVFLETKVVKTGTGEVLAVQNWQQTAVDLTAAAAAEKAMRLAGENLLPALLTDLAGIITEARLLTVVVDNVSYQQLMQFQQQLKETPMVKAVQLREYAGHKALLSVETTLTAPQLADQLAGGRGMDIEITGVSQFLIKLIFHGGWKP